MPTEPKTQTIENKFKYISDDNSEKIYEPTPFEKELIAIVFDKFRISADLRNQTQQNFDGLNLIEYIEDSYRRTITNIDVRDGAEEWQATIHDPFTRNKVNGILAKVVSVLPAVEVQNRGDDDVRKAQLVSEIYEYSEDADDYEQFALEFLYEAIVKGTAIGYEGHKYCERKIREVYGYGDEITVTEGVVKENKLFASLVRLEDFYPSSINVRSIKDMSYAFVRETLSYVQFINKYSGYEKHRVVQPKTVVGPSQDSRPYYLDFISNDINEGQVEVLYFYDKTNDQYVVIANGIWLNPIKTKEDSEIVCPLPFNHKELPFFEVKFEIIEPGFFYGKSLPDKLKNLQDVLNVLTNMLLDQSFLSIFTPILVAGTDMTEDDYLVPGRRIPVDTNGLPLNQSVMKLDTGTPSGWHQYILEYTRNVMEQASLDRVSQGVAGQGDRTTAREIQIAAEGVAAMLGLFGRFIKTAIKRKAMLRIKNILQFWTDKNYPVIEQVGGVGTGAEMKKYFNSFKIKNAVLSDGKRGLKVIDFYANPNDRPTQRELKMKSAMKKLTNNMEVEYVALDPAYIRNVDIDIKLVPNQKSDTVKDLDKALHLEKVRIYKELFPGVADDIELFAQTAEKFGDDPTKVMSKNALDSVMGTNQEADTAPRNNIANNTVRSVAGGEPGANSITQLQNQMLG